MLATYTQWLIKFRWLAIALSLLIVIACGAGMSRLTLTNDYEVFFGEDNPQLAAFKNLQDVYTKNDNLLIMLAPKNGQVFEPTTLQAIIDLTDSAWETPYSTRVDSLTNFQYTYAEDDDLSVIDLIENPESLTAEDLSRLQKIALEQPLLLNRLLSSKADVTGINITFELPTDGADQASIEIVDHIEATLADFTQRYPELDIKKTGVVAMNKAFNDAAMKDGSSLIPLAFGVILLGLLVLTRSLWGTIGAICVMLMSIVTAMGLAGWAGIVLTPPAINAPTLIMTLAVADCVHFMVTFFQQMRSGNDKAQAIRESIRVNFNPIFLTSVTTAIGFLCMNFSDSTPFHDLGNITATGVLFAFLYSIFFLPALFAVLPIKSPNPNAKKFGLMDKLASFSISQYRWLLPVIGLGIVVLAAMIPRNELNDDFVKYFDDSIEFRRDTDTISERLTGMFFVDYSLDSKSASGINTPEFLQQLEFFESWLLEQPEVVHINSVAETFRRLNQNMHGDDKQWYKLPENRDLAAQYMLMYEFSLPLGLDLNNQINIDKSATRLSATLENLSTKQMLDFEDRVNDWMDTNTPDIKTEGSSPAIMFSHIAKRNIRSMLGGTILALFLISGILMVSLRSVRYGLISLIPNLVPAGLAFGIWAIFNGQVGLSVSVIVAMTLGIVVDDTIHFLSKYLRGIREKGLATEEAIRYAFNTVGEALLITTVILTAGFMILSQSAFSLNSDMGLMTAITICIALFIDFFFLPPLLIWLDKRKSKGVITPGSLNPA